MTNPLLIVVSVLLLSLFMPGCGESNNRQSVSSITIHFLPWNLATYAALSCDDVMTSDDSVDILDPDEIKEFTLIYESLSLVELPEFDGIDARLCVVLYGAADSVIQRISYSGTSLMQIGDKVYRTDDSLFRFLLGYLPEDYLET